MPYKYNQNRRHHIPKSPNQSRDWTAYNQNTQDIAKTMLLLNEFSVETIARVTHRSVDEVKAIKTSLEQMKHGIKE